MWEGPCREPDAQWGHKNDDQAMTRWPPAECKDADGRGNHGRCITHPDHTPWSRPTPTPGSWLSLNNTQGGGGSDGQAVIPRRYNAGQLRAAKPHTEGPLPAKGVFPSLFGLTWPALIMFR